VKVDRFPEWICDGEEAASARRVETASRRSSSPDSDQLIQDRVNSSPSPAVQRSGQAGRREGKGQLELGGGGHSLPWGARLTPEGAPVGVELQAEASASDDKQRPRSTHLIGEDEIVGLTVESDPRASRLGRVLVNEERKPWDTRDLTRGVDTAGTPTTF